MSEELKAGTRAEQVRRARLASPAAALGKAVPSLGLSSLASIRAGTFPWHPELAEAAEALREAIEIVTPEAFGRALAQETDKRVSAAQAGLERYFGQAPVEQALPDPIWAMGGVCLRYYAPPPEAEPGPSALFVPSLINRAYVLDLMPERSLMRTMAANGVGALLVDWGDPSDEERGFDVDAYVTERLVPALEAAATQAGGPVVVVGYCMGGVLALAAALLRPDLVKAIVLIAVPWDFHEGTPAWVRYLIGEVRQKLPPNLRRTPGVFPSAFMDLVFNLVQADKNAGKFRGIAEAAWGEDDARAFVAVEDWLNDGVAVPLPVIMQALEDWYGDNQLAAGRWRVGGVRVAPELVRVPSFIIIATRDRLVPEACAEAITRGLTGSRMIKLRAGHVGMVAGRRAPDVLWPQLLRWIKDVGA